MLLAPQDSTDQTLLDRVDFHYWSAALSTKSTISTVTPSKRCSYFFCNIREWSTVILIYVLVEFSHRLGVALLQTGPSFTFVFVSRIPLNWWILITRIETIWVVYHSDWRLCFGFDITLQKRKANYSFSLRLIKITYTTSSLGVAFVLSEQSFFFWSNTAITWPIYGHSKDSSIHPAIAR